MTSPVLRSAWTRARSWMGGALVLATGLAWEARAEEPAPGKAPAGLEALVGTWVFQEHRNAEPAHPALRPNWGRVVEVTLEPETLVVRWPHATQPEVHRHALDGTEAEVRQGEAVARRRVRWEQGTLHVSHHVTRPGAGGKPVTMQSEQTLTPSGDQLVAVQHFRTPAPVQTTCLYRRLAPGLAWPTLKAAAITDIAWLTGAWTGTQARGRGTASIEERWSPPLGGAMLATARTVARGHMVSFEFLRIVERDGGLVYVAQPGGGAATEFVLTTLDAKRMVFENPAHDFPQRITYALDEQARLTAEISDREGRKSLRFQFDVPIQDPK